MRTRAKLVRINFFVPFPIPGHLSCRMPNLNCQSIVFIEFLFTTCINKFLWTHGIHLKCVIQRKYNIPQWGENWCLDCLPPKPTTQCICNYLLPHTHTHLYIHVHTHGAKRTDKWPTERTYFWRCEAVRRSRTWRGEVENAEGWGPGEGLPRRSRLHKT